jgi:hypothetical protein
MRELLLIEPVNDTARLSLFGVAQVLPSVADICKPLRRKLKTEAGSEPARA